MRKKFRKLICLLATCTLLAVSVVGCGDENVKADTGDSQNAKSAEKTQASDLKGKVLVKKSVGNFLNQQQLPITDIFYAVPIAFLSDCAQG